MTGANADIFQEAKERVSVPEAARRLGLEPNSAGKIRCFIHNGDNTPSLHLYEKNWNCYGCGEHGDAIDLVARYRNIGEREAAEWLLGESALPSAPKPKAPTDYGVFEREHVYPGGAVKKVINRRRDGSKSVCWEHLDSGQWKKGRGGLPPILYERGTPSRTVYIVEGEKDADNLFSLMGGYCASGENGAGRNGKWRPEYAERLRAVGVKNAVIFSDNDQVGRDYAEETAAALSEIAERVKLLDLRRVWPEIPEHGDVSDLIAHFGAGEALSLIGGLENDTPQWTPAPIADTPAAESGFMPFVPFEKPASESLPPFPVDALPLALSEFALTMSVYTEKDIALSAVPALGGAAIAIGKKFQVNSKPGWNEPLNLYSITSADSGGRKSETLKWVKHPLTEYQREWNINHAADFDAWRDDLDITRNEIAAKKSAIAKGKTKADALEALRGEIDNLRARERSLEGNPQKPLCLFTQDCTPEKLGRLLQDNAETMSIISDEGGFFLTLTGKRYSENANLDCLLNAYTLSSVQSARVTSDDVDLKAPCLNIVAACQPITVEELTVSRVYNRRGLTARFLYAFAKKYERPPNVDPMTDPLPPWDEAVNNYNCLIRDLLSITPDYDERGELAPRIIVFSPEAMKLRRALELEAERLSDDLRGGDPFVYWLARYHAHVVRLAGILHVCKHRNEADAVELSTETFQKALTLGRYFKAHSGYAFSMSGASMSEAEKDARYIWKRIRESGQDKIGKRDLTRSCQGRFKKAEDMDAGINELVAHGYIRVVKSGEGRGRPSETIETNPEAENEN